MYDTKDSQKQQENFSSKYIHHNQSTKQQPKSIDSATNQIIDSDFPHLKFEPEEFLHSIQSGDYQIFDQCISLASKLELLNFIDNQGRSYLLLAIQVNQPKMAKALIQIGVDINHQDNEDKIALHYLCNQHDQYTELLNILIIQGADFTITDKEGNTPLIIALKRKCDCSFIKKLIKQCQLSKNKTLEKAWSIQNKQKESPLSYILDRQYYDILEVVIDSLGDLNIKMPSNRYLVFEILELQKLDFFKKICQKKFNANLQNEEKETILHILCKEITKYESIIIYLLKNYDIDLLSENSQGATALSIALSQLPSKKLISSMLQIKNFSRNLNMFQKMKEKKGLNNAVQRSNKNIEKEFIKFQLEIVQVKSSIEKITNQVFPEDGNLNKILLNSIRDQNVPLWELIISLNIKLDSQKDLITGEDIRLKYFDKQNGIQNVYSITFSPDGTMVASGCGYHKIKVWNVISGQCLLTLETDVSTVTWLSFSDDGKRIVSAGRDGRYHYFNIRNSGESIYSNQIELNSSEELLAMSYNTKKIVSLENQRDICYLKLWKWQLGKWTKIILDERINQRVASATISQDEKRVATSFFEKQIKIWDVDTLECINVLQNQDCSVCNLAFSLDRKKLISYLENGEIFVWDIESTRILSKLCNTIVNHSSSEMLPIGVGISPNLKQIAFGTQDKSIELWDIEQNECLKILSEIEQLIISPSRKIFATHRTNKKVHIQDSKSGNSLFEIDVDSRYYLIMKFSQDERYLLINDGRQIQVIETENGNYLFRDSTNLGTFSQDGRNVVTSKSNQIKITSLETNESTILNLQEGLNNLYQIDISPNGTKITCSFTENEISLWDVKSQECEHLLMAKQNISRNDSLQFSLDNKQIIFVNSNIIQVGDVEKGKWLYETNGFEAILTPNGKQFLSVGYYDFPTKFIDLQSGNCVWQLKNQLYKQSKDIFIISDSIIQASLAYGCSMGYILLQLIQEGQFMPCIYLIDQIKDKDQLFQIFYQKYENDQNLIRLTIQQSQTEILEKLEIMIGRRLYTRLVSTAQNTKNHCCNIF